MQYDAIILGAGAAGLASALKLSGSGKKVILLEKQPRPGGFATCFNRKGYTFESAVHCVDALSKDGRIRNFLEEAGVAKEVDFIELNNFVRVSYPEHDFTVDSNCNNFISFLKRTFPQEESNIDKLFSDFDSFYKTLAVFNAPGAPGQMKKIMAAFASADMIKASSLTTEQFIQQHIQDPKLKAIIPSIWGFSGLPPSRLSAFYFLILFNGYHYNPTCYIKGGFRRLFEAMANKIQENGSEVRFNTAVKKIITGVDNQAKAVLTENGQELKAGTIISNANCFDTLVNFPDNDAVRESYRKKLFSLEKSISAFQVYLGLKVPAESLGMKQFMWFLCNNYNHDENFQYSLSGDYDNSSISLVDHAQIDRALAPEGKGTLLIFTLDAYSNWENLGRQEYQNKKLQAADKLIRRVEKYLPGLSKCIEVMEIATPKTIARFGPSPEGAIYGFAQTVNQAGIKRLAQVTKIKGLFLAGAWTRPGGGVHACFISGIQAAELALRFLK
ncbi:MAG: NAD(P)/FAD-dependent oxidoreductase [Candidatus Omnitrophota bacterium]